jgi:hypothetical protein
MNYNHLRPEERYYLNLARLYVLSQFNQCIAIRYFQRLCTYYTNSGYIDIELKKGTSQNKMAKSLGRSQGSISRERACVLSQFNQCIAIRYFQRLCTYYTNSGNDILSHMSQNQAA